MTDVEKREAFEALMASPGWQLLQEEMTTEWAAKCEKGMRNCANVTDDIVALNKLRQMLAADSAVREVFAMPARLIKQYKAQENGAPPLETRRQDHDRMVGAMSRRGGL